MRPQAVICTGRGFLAGNAIIDSGDDQGVAIEITGKTRDLAIVDSKIRETRGTAARTGIRIGRDVGSIELRGNIFEGFATDIADLRQA